MPAYDAGYWIRQGAKIRSTANDIKRNDESLALELDEENLEYVSSFANFCLDCGRIPMAIKEYQRLEKMAQLNEIPVEDTLFEASRLIVEAIERLDPERKNPTV